MGDAAGALALWQRGELDVTRPAADAETEFLRQRLLRPVPRVQLGLALRSIATAAVDVSDGLMADLGHIAARSGVAAHVDADLLPCSTALQRVLGSEAARSCALQGGDDYELCFTAAVTSRRRLLALSGELGISLTRIGAMLHGEGVHCPGSGAVHGYVHFLSPPMAAGDQS